MNEPNTEPKRIIAPKRSFRVKIIDDLDKRIVIIKKKLKKWQSYADELKQMEDTLKMLRAGIEQPVIENGVKNTLLETPRVGKEELYDRPNDDTPLQSKGMDILKIVPQSFVVEDVERHLDNNKAKAYQHIATWKRKFLIVTTGFGKYRRVDEIK